MPEQRHDDGQAEEERQRADATSSAATTMPQTIMVTGLRTTARIDVSTATAAPTSRSSKQRK